MAWTTPTTRATGFLVTAAIYNADIINNLIALQNGDIALTKVQLDGGAADPAVSAAADATIYLSTLVPWPHALRISNNAGNYQAFASGFQLADWLALSNGI